MTKYLKIVLFAVIGIMFSGIAEAAITPINEAENDLKFGSRKKGELKCDNITTFSSPKSGMDCKVVTLSDNKTQCWKCDCSQKDYPYTKENCSGKLILDTSSSSCTDITTGKKYYKTCECGEGLLTAEEAKKYDTYFDIGSPVQSAGNLACYDPKKFTCKTASNKITVSDITSYQHTSAKTRVKSKNEPVWYEVATNIETSNKDHNDLVMCVKKVDEFTSNVMSFQPEAITCVETSTGTTRFLNTSYHYYSGCNTTRSGCQESSHPCVEKEIVEVNGYSTSTKEAKTFSCSHISGCKIGKQGDSLCDKAPATDNPDLVYNKDNGCALISCSSNYEYVGSGTGETSFNGANGDSANTNYTYVSKAPDATSDGWIVCRMENSSPIDKTTNEEEGICPDDATLTADGECECINPDKKLVTDDDGEMYCECEEGYYDNLFDGEDKCVVDPNSEVMQCPEPSILNEDTGECICEDDSVCSLSCVDGKYELCGYFPVTATGTTCTDLIWDHQKQMYLCKTGSTTFTSTRWDCIKTERKCKQAPKNDCPGFSSVQVGQVCKLMTTSNGFSCFNDCQVVDNCGTAVAKDDNIIYAYPTNVVVGSVQNGEYNCCPNKGTDDYCDEMKYDCEYEECSGKWINNGCNLAYFDMEFTNGRYSTCPKGTYLDKCTVDEIYYTCSDPVYGPDTLDVALNITPSYWGNCPDYQIGKYNISVIFTDLNGNKITASANNITRNSGSLTINFDNPIPVGRYNVDIVGNFSGGINQCNSVTYSTHEWGNNTPINEGMWILGTPYKSLPSGGIDIDVHKGMSPIITLYMYLGGFS